MNKYKKQLLYYWLAFLNYKPPGLYLLVVTLIAVSFTALPVGYVLIRPEKKLKLLGRAYGRGGHGYGMM